MEEVKKVIPRRLDKEEFDKLIEENKN